MLDHKFLCPFCMGFIKEKVCDDPEFVQNGLPANSANRCYRCFKIFNVVGASFKASKSEELKRWKEHQRDCHDN